MAMEYQLAPTFSRMDEEMDLGGNTKMHWAQSNNYHQDDYCGKERPLIERCHPRDYLSRNTLWPRSVFHRLWRQNIISICSIRWRDLIKCPGRGPPSYQWEAWSWWPSITPWQLANKYYQQERGAGPGRGHGGQTIDHRAVPSCIAPLNRVQ